MDLMNLFKKYDFVEGILRSNNSEKEFESKLKPNHKKIYLILRNTIDGGVVILIIITVLYFVLKNYLYANLSIWIVIIVVVLSIIRQRMRKYIKKKIQNKEY